MSADVQRAVARAAGEMYPSLIVLDSLTIAAYGGEMLQAPDVTALMKFLESLGTVLALDHQAAPQKDRTSYRPYGSTFKFNLARSVIHVTRGSGGGFVVTHKKSNFGALVPPFGVVAEWSAGAVTFHPVGLGDPSVEGPGVGLSAVDRVAAALERHPDGVEPQTLADALGMKLPTVRNHLTKLREQQRAERRGQGIWAPRAPEERAA
jgi:hypothetical protein